MTDERQTGSPPTPEATIAKLSAFAACHSVGAVRDLATEALAAIRAAVAADKPKWAATPPTEPGWYWWRRDDSYDPVMAIVKRCPDGLVLSRLFKRLDWRLPSHCGGEWAGPLTPPE
jgi:hypothetical protein